MFFSEKYGGAVLTESFSFNLGTDENLAREWVSWRKPAELKSLAQHALNNFEASAKITGAYPEYHVLCGLN